MALWSPGFADCRFRGASAGTRTPRSNREPLDHGCSATGNFLQRIARPPYPRCLIRATVSQSALEPADFSTARWPTNSSGRSSIPASFLRPRRSIADSRTSGVRILRSDRPARRPRISEDRYAGRSPRTALSTTGRGALSHIFAAPPVHGPIACLRIPSAFGHAVAPRGNPGLPKMPIVAASSPLPRRRALPQTALPHRPRKPTLHHLLRRPHARRS